MTAVMALADAPAWRERGSGLLRRMGANLQSFLYLLTHDTAGMVERAVLAPYLLGTWFVASMLVSPLSLLLLKALRAQSDLGTVAGANFAITLTQLAFFAVNWYAMQWGDRTVDLAVFCATLIPATLIAKLALKLTLPRAIAFVASQTFFTLVVIFLALFVGSEMGRFTF